MRKIYKISIFLIVIAFGISMAYSRVKSVKSYIENLTGELYKKSGYRFTIGGTPSVEISDKVTIIMPNIIVHFSDDKVSEQYIRADSLIITLPWSSFIFKTKHFSSVRLINADVVADHSNNFEVAYTLNKDFRVKVFSIENSNLYFDENLDMPVFSQVNMKVHFNRDDIAIIKGDLVADGIFYNIDVNFDRGKDETVPKVLNFSASNSAINININTKTLNKISQGDLKVDVSNPAILAHYFSAILPPLDKYSNLKIDNPIRILSNLDSEDLNIKLSNVQVISDDIIGQGNIDFSLKNNLNLNISMRFDKFNFKNLLAKKIDNSKISQTSSLSDQNYQGDTEVSSFINFGALKNNITIDLSAKEINLQNILLQNFNLTFNNINDKVTDSAVSFTITGANNSSNFVIDNLSKQTVDGIEILLGSFSNGGNNIDDTLDLFQLKDTISIEENNLSYSFNSQIIIAPTEISLFNIAGTVGTNEGIFSGSIATRVDTLNTYNIDLQFSRIALDNFNLPIFKSRLQDLLTGSNQDDYISKFIWFRTLPSSYTIKFRFTDTEFNQNKIDDFSILCALSPANMQIRGLVKAPFADTGFAVNLKATSIKPEVDIKVYGKYLDYDIVSSFFDSVLPKGSTNTDVNSSVIWSSDTLDVFRITRYNAIIDVIQDSLNFKKHSINNFQIATHTLNDVLYIDKFGLSLYGGYFQGSGNISYFSRLLYQFSVSGSNIDSKSFFTDISPSLHALSGPFSFTTSFATEGNSLKDLASNLSLSSNFAAANLTIDGIDSDTVVDYALQRKNTPKDKLLSAIANSLYTGSTQISGIAGTCSGSKGLIQSNDLVFKTRFNSAVSAFSFDFNTLSLASNTKFSFLSYGGTTPITYNVLVSGNLRDGLKQDLDQKDLISFVKKTYNIVTEEDILAEKKAKNIAAKKAAIQGQIQNPNDANYLYYKLQMEQIDAQQN